MSITLPVGRMIGGSLSKLFQAKDNNKQPKLKQDGTPDMRCNFGVAIPKGQETHWNQTPWGQQIYAAGQAGFPNGEFQAPTFAWKVIDGDSQIPNKSGNKPCEQTGYVGHWIMWFNNGWLPKKVNADGSQLLTDEEAIKPGYFIQVLAEVTGNNSTQSPGVYLNPEAVALSYVGEIIAGTGDVDTTDVGFGQGTVMPEGASAVPPAAAGFAPPPPVAGTLPHAPNGQPAPPVGNPSVPVNPAALPPATPPVMPNTGADVPDYLNGPAQTPPAQTPPVPPAPAAPVSAGSVMLPAANGATYESLIAAGWTDETLRANGMMQ